MQSYKLLIDGQLVESSQKKYFDSINPSTGEVLAKVADASHEDMLRAISSARVAFDSGVWAALPIKERGTYLKRIADLIRENAKIFSDLECADTGKTVKQTTLIDVPTIADTFEYFSDVGSQLDEETNSVPSSVKSLTRREPMGVVGCIIPWNYPLIMTGWKVAPALIAGNTVVFRPSCQASVSIMKLAEIFEKAGLPKGVLNVVASSDREVAAELFKSKDVDMVSFTGGTETGEEVMRLASSTTKKITLELGGKSPNIVFADCDLEAAIGGTMSAIFMNQGQMCTAGSRLLLEDKIYDEFLNRLIEKTKNLKVGPAASYETDFGPMISGGHRNNILEFIRIGEKEGAKLVCGGKIPYGADLMKGFYMEPTIFVDVQNTMTIAQDEIFGPVLCVIKFSNLKEAIKIANDTKYGLASCVWTKNLDKAKNVAQALRCGTVWINTYGGFYNEAPIGGFKRSGFGRELGKEGLLEYTQTKHVCIDQTPGGKPLVAAWF